MKTVKLLIPSSKYNLKQTYPMKPIGVTVHNTWNTATALAEASYMAGNKLQTSFHWVVDENQAVQCATMTRNCWHAGDGNGNGNRRTIGVEIARSRSNLALFKQAEKNGAKLVAKLLNDHGWTIKQLYKHQDWSGKYCPHRTLDLGWERFKKLVETELKAFRGTTKKVDPKKVWGRTATLKAQKKYGTVQDGVISNQPSVNQKRFKAYTTTTWKFKKSGYKAGSSLIKAMQRDLKKKGYYKGAIDGWAGQDFIKGLQRMLKAKGLYKGKIDGNLGELTATAFNKFLDS